MNYEEEINCRKQILSRIRKGEHITSDERLWLVTHRIINETLGYPYLNTDVIHIQPKKDYCIRVKVERLRYPERILPVITVPGGKGMILANTPLANLNGKVTFGKPVKMLGLLIDSEHKETEILFRSDLGILGVSYQSDYYDDKQRFMVRKDSGTGDPAYAMLRESLSDNKILYRCKTPINNNFEDFMFSIEWYNSTGDGSVAQGTVLGGQGDGSVCER